MKIDKLKLQLIKMIVSGSPDTHNLNGLQSLLVNEIEICRRNLGEYKNED